MILLLTKESVIKWTKEFELPQGEVLHLYGQGLARFFGAREWNGSKGWECEGDRTASRC